MSDLTLAEAREFLKLDDTNNSNEFSVFYNASVSWNFEDCFSFLPVMDFLIDARRLELWLMYYNIIIENIPEFWDVQTLDIDLSFPLTNSGTFFGVENEELEIQSFFYDWTRYIPAGRYVGSSDDVISLRNIAMRIPFYNRFGETTEFNDDFFFESSPLEIEGVVYDFDSAYLNYDEAEDPIGYRDYVFTCFARFNRESDSNIVGELESELYRKFNSVSNTPKLEIRVSVLTLDGSLSGFFDFDSVLNVISLTSDGFIQKATSDWSVSEDKKYFEASIEITRVFGRSPSYFNNSDEIILNNDYFTITKLIINGVNYLNKDVTERIFLIVGIYHNRFTGLYSMPYRTNRVMAYLATEDLYKPLKFPKIPDFQQELPHTEEDASFVETSLSYDSMYNSISVDIVIYTEPHRQDGINVGFENRAEVSSVIPILQGKGNAVVVSYYLQGRGGKLYTEYWQNGMVKPFIVGGTGKHIYYQVVLWTKDSDSFVSREEMISELEGLVDSDEPLDDTEFGENVFSVAFQSTYKTRRLEFSPNPYIQSFVNGYAEFIYDNNIIRVAPSADGFFEQPSYQDRFDNLKFKKDEVQV